MIHRPFLLLTCLLCFPALLTANEADLREQTRRYMELIQSGGDAVIDGEAVASVQVLPAL